MDPSKTCVSESGSARTELLLARSSDLCVWALFCAETSTRLRFATAGSRRTVTRVCFAVKNAHACPVFSAGAAHRHESPIKARRQSRLSTSAPSRHAAGLSRAGLGWFFRQEPKNPYTKPDSGQPPAPCLVGTIQTKGLFLGRFPRREATLWNATEKADAFGKCHQPRGCNYRFLGVERPSVLWAKIRNRFSDPPRHRNPKQSIGT